MDIELRERMDRMEGQGGDILNALDGLAEQVRVAVFQTAEIIRLMTAENPPREGPSLEDLLQGVISLLHAQGGILVEVRDGIREIGGQRGLSTRDGGGKRPQ